MKPTDEQFRKYRTRRRNAVNRIARCHRAGLCVMTNWTRDVILRSRNEHSQSIRRQAKGEAG